MTDIGKLESVPLRELWKHEERGFSAWLESNLGALGEALGVSLSDPQREVTAGSFQVDLVAEDEDGNQVIVENQLEATNHDHLGKIITYTSNLEAKTAVWITSHARPEHVRAIQWLNETTPSDVSFFLVQLAAYRIANSLPAPLFTVIVGPSPESKDFGRQKQELAERHLLRLQFWTQLLARAKEKGLMLHAQRTPGKDSWISAGAGIRSGLHYNYVVWMKDETAVEFYMDTGDKDENKRIFDQLAANKERIEGAFGGPLSWERLDEKRGCRIRYTLAIGGLTDGGERWPGIQDAMVDAMSRLSKSLHPHLQKLK